MTFVLLASLFAGRSDAQGAHRKLTPIDQLGPLSAGLTLPIQIARSFKAGSSKPGTEIVGTTTQRVTLSDVSYLPAGAKVSGSVVASEAAHPESAQPATLTLRFTALSSRGQTVPILTRAVAIANFTDVSDTAAPANGSTDRGNSSPASWTTRQVGGDEVCRSGWIGEVVDSTTHRVGFADYYGVYADPPAGATGTAAIPRAIGVFSTSARGLYGFNVGDELRSLDGEITLTSAGGLILRNGDNLLLEIVAAP